MPKFGRKSRERLETCHPDLQTLFNAEREKVYSESFKRVKGMDDLTPYEPPKPKPKAKAKPKAKPKAKKGSKK